MTSLFDLDQNSSDSEDDLDYVPEEGKLSENDVTDGESLPSSDDEKLLPQNRKLGTKRSSRKRKKHNPVAEEKDSVETKVSSVGEKLKADDVWKSFLDEVAETPLKTVDATSVVSDPVSSSVEESPKSLLSSSDKPKSPQKEIDEIFEFAGETISVTKDGSVSEIVSSVKDNSVLGENSLAKEDAIPPPGKRKGLQSVLGTLMNKKQKITTLQKTLIDWKSYKKDEGIEEELETFNKGKGGFIERQRFLQRSDLRSYEIERDLRHTKTKKT